MENNKFLTNYAKTLIILYDKRVIMGKDFFIPFTQTEICEIIKSNKTTVNNLFKEYREDNMIEKRNGRYYFTESAVKAVKKLKKILKD